MLHINTSILSFYNSLSAQSHNVEYAYGSKYRIIGPATRLLPFQVIVNTTMFSSITGAYVKSSTANIVVKDVTAYIQADVSIKTFTGYRVIVFNGLNFLDTPLVDGIYYLELTDGTSTIVSDLFNAVNTIQASEFISLTYWDNSDYIFQHTLGRIVYSEGYKNKVYLPTKLAKPEYKVEEVIEDRDGFKFVEKQITKKIFKFSFLANEPLCDLMSLVSSHDNVIIVYNNKIYNVYDILFTPEWLPDGYLANVDAEFSTDAIIKKIGRAFPKHSQGDFNSDFNSDFNII